MISTTHAPLGRGRTLLTGVLVAVAAVLLAALFAAIGSDRLAADFNGSYLEAAEAVRMGGTPYGGDDAFPYLYPPLLAELAVPLTLVPHEIASAFALVASLAAVMGALALVGVRDLRCYAAFAIWAPVWNVLEMANATALLALLAGLVWRYRARTWTSAGVLGFSLALKFVLAPLLLWMWATRRARAALLAVGVGVVALIASWAAVGFAGLTSYSDQVGKLEFSDSYSLLGIAQALDSGPVAGRLAMIAGGLGLLLAVVVLGRRGDEVRAFTCAIVAALVLAPVVWLHYLVLLAVPLGISRPRFAPIWLLPIVLWMCPRAGHGDGLQPFVPALVVAALFAVLMVHPGPERHGRAAGAVT